MKAWTVQTNEAFAILNRDGVLYCDCPRCARYMDDGNDGVFNRAYDWMMSQMERRIPVSRPQQAAYPLWVWVQVGSYKKEYHPSGNDYTHGKDVLLELDIPEDQILLSDFDLWHCVLNEGSTGTDRLMEKALDRFYCQNKEATLQEYPQELREYVIQSWERIFQLDRRDRNASRMRRNRTIQGTLWQIRSEWVRSYRML